MNTDHIRSRKLSGAQIAKSQGSRPVAYGEPLGPRFVDENTKVNRWDRWMATRSSKMGKMGWSKSSYVKMKCVVLKMIIYINYMGMSENGVYPQL